MLFNNIEDMGTLIYDEDDDLIKRPLLPFSLRVAASTVAIDLVKVHPTDQPRIERLIWTIKIGNWEDRLIKYSIQQLTKDILEAKEKNLNAVLYPYLLGGVFKTFWFFVSTKLNYEVK